MPVQACARNIGQCFSELLDRARFMKQEILKNPLPDRVHHNFDHLHAVSPLPESFYDHIIFSFLRMSSEINYKQRKRKSEKWQAAPLRSVPFIGNTDHFFNKAFLFRRGACPAHNYICGAVERISHKVTIMLTLSKIGIFATKSTEIRSFRCFLPSVYKKDATRKALSRKAFRRCSIA